MYFSHSYFFLYILRRLFTLPFCLNEKELCLFFTTNLPISNQSDNICGSLKERYCSHPYY
jgi:hypothetical protein